MENWLEFADLTQKIFNPNLNFLTQNKNELTRDPTLFCEPTRPNLRPEQFFLKKIWGKKNRIKAILV